MTIRLFSLTVLVILTFAAQAFAADEASPAAQTQPSEVKPVEVKAKKSYEVMEPKPGVHSCSVTNMPANSACAGTIKEGSWETKLTYKASAMTKMYSGSTLVANPMNQTMNMSMAMAMLSYGVTDNLLVATMIPTVSKSMTGGMVSSVAGLGDITLTAKWRIWSDGDITTPPQSFDDLREKGNSVALFAGVKAPTGNNDLIHTMGMGTMRNSEMMQLGTGSWDSRFGLSYSRDMNPLWIHASVFQNLTGMNRYGYKWGDKTEYNLVFQFEPWINTVLDLELNGESCNVSALNGTTVANTGSTKLFLTPALQYQFNDNWDLEAGYSIPLSWNVTGTQLMDDYRWFVGFRGAIL